MRPIETVPVVAALGWTLIHFVWQGAIVALFLAIVKAALKNRTANLRYLASCAAMLLMFALPLITFVTLSSGVAETRFVTPGPAPGMASLKSKLGAGSPLAGEWIQATAPASKNLRKVFSEFAPWLASLWLAGVVVLSLRMLGGWFYARRLNRHPTGMLPDEWRQRFAGLCREIRVLRPVRILESALVQVPTVIGWMRPVVLIPVSALAGLTPRQLEAVIAHELAHIRRYDYLVNLLQTAVEILLFYHPGVWWVSREIRQEREHCCDDVAVEVCGDALTYARALAEIEALRDIRPQLAMAADGGSLLARIERIIGGSPRRSEQTASWITGAIVIATVFGFAAAAQLFSPSTRANGPIAINETPRLPAAGRNPAANLSGVAAREIEASDGEAVKGETIEQDGGPAAGAGATGPQGSQGSGSSFIEEMAALGYTDLSVDDFIALKNHGVTPQFVRELKAQGYDKLSVGQLTRLKATGVSPQLIKELAAAGLKQPQVESLVRLQAHGVSPALIKELGELGYKDLSADQLTRVAGHGVTPQFVRDLQSAGYKDLAIDDVVRVHDHGVGAELVKAIRGQGYDGLTIDEVIRVSDHGVGLEFMREMNAAGFGRIPVDQLVRARDHGVDPEVLRKIRAAGYSNATLDQLIGMKDHSVTPDYIDSVRKAGYDNVSLDQLIRMKDHGVDAEFIRRAKSHGFQKLSPDQLIRLRDAGILD